TQLRQHADGRDPIGDAELDAHLRADAFVHEAGIDQHHLVATLCQHEGEGQVHHAVVMRAADQAVERLVLRPGELDDIDIPVVRHRALPQFSAICRPRLDRPTATIRMAPWKTYCEKVGAPKMLRPLKPKAMMRAPTKVPT